MISYCIGKRFSTCCKKYSFDKTLQNFEVIEILIKACKSKKEEKEKKDLIETTYTAFCSFADQCLIDLD